jgi:basic amino acid/polyamine antiporter, APA family
MVVGPADLEAEAAVIAPPSLARRLGVGHAVFLGLGAIVGTGVFVSIGIAAGVAGPAVVAATALAAAVATANALNSAQLAAGHPVSGGTYEYGYRYLTPALGFSAGWMFLCAKTASASTAALGFAGYALSSLGAGEEAIVPVAAGAAVAVTLLVLWGMRQSAWANAAIVLVTLAALATFCMAGLPAAVRNGPAELTPFFRPVEGETPLTSLLHAAALMFVAFTGYGRVATLGEEVVEPRRTIPRAIVLTLIISAALYMAVSTVAVASVGADALASATDGRAAPLEQVSRSFGVPAVPPLVAFGAVTAMLGVLLNLVLGLSRVVLAMARRGDLPAAFARITTGGTPGPAVLLMGAAVAILTLVGSVRVAWSFSAFTVLIYYAVTNLAALRLPPDERLYPKWLGYAGLAACLSLAFFVEPAVWVTGLAVLAVGLAWHAFRRYGRAHPSGRSDPRP